MPTLYIDADACPVREEALKVALRHGANVVFVSNGGIRPVNHPLVRMVYVDQGADEADKWIAAACVPGDVAVTGDIPLAARCLEAGAAVLKHDGSELTPVNIGQILAMRDLAADLRAADPFRQGSGKVFGPRDRSRFSQALDRLLVNRK
ncbi:YaiI/YqxD family protein [Pararhodobacter zhoushanensis]|uniref:YaiI/YqxD family protein n=1 Tax=Pararhodobacter zhoushanensis TaxID=2479545 RepID=UPI000F8C537D|nr:YaiI/YqxD family protein [Pararhodobacter zhoushanensis]